MSDQGKPYMPLEDVIRIVKERDEQIAQLKKKIVSANRIAKQEADVYRIGVEELARRQVVVDAAVLWYDADPNDSISTEKLIEAITKYLSRDCKP